MNNVSPKNKLNIVVIGANGGIGKSAVELALDAGHHVIAILRTPSKLTIKHPNLDVVKGDVMIPSSFENHLIGADAVISALGVAPDKMKASPPPVTLYSEGNRNILNAMQKHNVSRIYSISASAIEISPANPFYVRLLTKLIVQKLFGKAYADQRIMEQLFRESPLNWTVIRPPRLLNKQVSGKYRFAANKFLKNCLTISRADVAHFMLNHIADPATYKAIVEIAY